jgi:DNA topoisomerase-1
VSDQQPGFHRVPSGKSFRYLNVRGRPVRNAHQLARIKSIVIPPAWRNVWICPHANGHLQATGIDARGRKQYRYHPEWTANRNQVKFDAMTHFALALPTIRRRVRRDLARHGIPKEKVIACVVRLMDNALIRVGNDEYAKANDSYGLTTIRNHHVQVNGHAIRFCFKGKSGQKIETTIHDPRAAKVIRKCQDLPGQEVFEYIDDHGRHRDVTSGDVNDYLYEICGERFTAKDFRTWGGTVVAAEALLACGTCLNGRQRRSRPGQPSLRVLAKTRNVGSGRRAAAGTKAGSLQAADSLSQRELKKRCSQAVQKAAEALGNRVATCRKFYVHPKLAECYSDGRLEKAFNAAARQRKPPELAREERAVLHLMQSLS